MKLTRKKKALGILLLLVLLIVPTFAFYLYSPQRRMMRHLVKAQIRANNNQTGAALVEYDNVLKIDPKNEIALCELGHVRLQMEQFDRAAEQFDHCLKVYPKNFRAGLGMVRARIGQKNFAAAETASQNLLLQQRDVQSLMASGDVQQAKECYDAALHAYRDAIHSDPKEFDPVLRSVLVLRLVKRDLTARQYLLDYAARPDGRERERALTLLTELSQQEERPQEALALVDQAIAIKLTPELLMRRADIQNLLGSTAQARADIEQVFKDPAAPPPPLAHVIRARCLLDQKEFDAALRDALLAQRTFPNDPRLALLLARIHHETKREMQAEEEARRALVLSPDFHAAQDFLMGLYLERGNLDEAINLGRNLVKRPKRNENAVRLFIRACTAADRADEARKALDTHKILKTNGLRLTLNTQSPLRAADTAEQAVEKFLALPAEQRETASIQLLLGHSFLRSDRLSDALRSFEHAVELDASTSEAQLALAGIHLALGNSDLGGDYLQKVVTSHPKHYKSVAWLAQVRMQQKKFGEADALYAQLASLDKSSIPAHMNRVKAKLLAQDEAGLQTLAQELQGGEPPDSKALSLYIQSLLAKKSDTASAQALLDQALQASPNFGPALQAKAVLAIHAGNTAQAAELLKLAQTSAVQPASSPHLDYAAALLFSGQTAEARAGVVENHLLLKNGDSLILAVALELKAEKVEAALAHIRNSSMEGHALHSLEAVAQLPMAKTILEKFVLCDFYARGGHTEWAVESLKQAHDLSPSSPDLAALHANGLIDLGKMAEARAFLDAATKQHRQRVDLVLALAQVAQAETKTDEAIEHLKRALELEPGELKALKVLGTLLMSRNEWSSASEYLQEAVRKSPHDMVSLNNLAWLTAVNLKSPQKALNYAENLLLIAPTNAHALDTAGWVYYLNNDLPRAQKSLAFAAELAPRDPDIAYHNAVVLLKSGKRAQALLELKRAKSIKQDFKSAQDVDAMIADLERTVSN